MTIYKSNAQTEKIMEMRYDTILREQVNSQNGNLEAITESCQIFSVDNGILCEISVNILILQKIYPFK